MMFRGLIAAAGHKYGEAETLLQASGEFAKKEPQAMLALARCRYELGKTQEALELTRNLDEAILERPEQSIELAQLNLDLGRPEQALTALEAAEAKYSSLTLFDYPRAVVLTHLGRHSEALDVLRRNTVLSTKGESLSLIALNASKLGHLEVAVHSLRRAIELEPAVEDHYLDLSSLCIQHDGEGLAQEIIDLALKRIPNSYRLLVQKGAILERTEKREEAKEIFTRAISLQADHRLALGGLAITQLYGGEMDEAIVLLQEGVNRFPNDFYLHYLYAYALQNPSRAASVHATEDQLTIRRVLEKAIQLNPNFADSYYRLGKSYFPTDVQKAIVHFETALRLDSNHVSAKYQLAGLYLKLGRDEEGARLMEEIKKTKAATLAEEQKPRLGLVRGTPSLRVRTTETSNR
jgi:tetratricopeptide (TPR) repeat protein